MKKSHLTHSKEGSFQNFWHFLALSFVQPYSYIVDVSTLTCTTTVHLDPHRYVTMPRSGVKLYIVSVNRRVDWLFYQGISVKVASEQLKY